MRWRAARLVGLLLLVWLLVLGIGISATGRETSPRNADVAIVLGAAVRDGRASPVFEERIRHGIALYRAGRVRALLFTGGHPPAVPRGHAESLVARRYAMAQGVPEEAILTETRSRTTLQNLEEARGVMQGKGFATALIVSDPLHMKRALRMASDLGIDATGSPTPTTRYRSWNSKAGFLLREMLFYNVYLIAGQ